MKKSKTEKTANPALTLYELVSAERFPGTLFGLGLYNERNVMKKHKKYN